MRRVLTTTNESHPDVPGNVTGEGSIFGPVLWQIYVDGTPFLGVPTTQVGASQEANRQALKVLATGRYEYVDVRLRPDRRTLEDRRAGDYSRRDLKQQYACFATQRTDLDGRRRGGRNRRQP